MNVRAATSAATALAVLPGVGSYHRFLHTSIPDSYFSLSIATTAEKDKETPFFMVLGAYPTTHPTCSLFLLSREQGMGSCSCHICSHTFPVLTEKGKSVLQMGHGDMFLMIRTSPSLHS